MGDLKYDQDQYILNEGVIQQNIITCHGMEMQETNVVGQDSFYCCMLSFEKKSDFFGQRDMKSLNLPNKKFALSLMSKYAGQAS